MGGRDTSERGTERRPPEKRATCMATWTEDYIYLENSGEIRGKLSGDIALQLWPRSGMGW